MARKMDLDKYKYVCKIEGLAYVKNSDGKSGNVNFFTGITLDTKTNLHLEIKYTVEVFNDKEMKDSFRESYTSYEDAVNKYNELAEKWDVYRIINN